MACHAASFALTARARTDDEVVAAGAERGDHVGDRRRIVGAVAVHEDDDVGVIGCLCAGEAGAAVTAAGFDRLRAGAARLRDGVVSAAAVGDDHAVDDSDAAGRQRRRRSIRFR